MVGTSREASHAELRTDYIYRNQAENKTFLLALSVLNRILLPVFYDSVILQFYDSMILLPEAQLE